MAIDKERGGISLERTLTDLTTADVDRIVEVTGAENRNIGPAIDSSESGSLYLTHRGTRLTFFAKDWEDGLPVLGISAEGSSRRRATVSMCNPTFEIIDNEVVFRERTETSVATLIMSKDNLTYTLTSVDPVG